MNNKYKGLETTLEKALNKVAAKDHKNFLRTKEDIKNDKIKADRLRFWRREMTNSEMVRFLKAEKKRELINEAKRLTYERD